MNTNLIDIVRRYLDAHADTVGLAQTPVSGLTIIRSTKPSDLQHAIPNPLICLILQGTKRVTLGKETYNFEAGNSLLITADVPTVSQITHASTDKPYMALVLDLDPVVISDLVLDMKMVPRVNGAAVRYDATDTDVQDTALRLMKLVDRPESLPVLHSQLVREMHYWLLSGRHGEAIRRLGAPESREQRISRSVAILRADFRKTLPVEQLAAEAGMGVSSFYQHFRAVTSLSPLQFQKQLRLIEARRLMVSRGLSASSAAFDVGYESVSQFSREYRRLFGLSPSRDKESAKKMLLTK